MGRKDMRMVKGGEFGGKEILIERRKTEKKYWIGRDEE